MYFEKFSYHSFMGCLDYEDGYQVFFFDFVLYIFVSLLLFFCDSLDSVSVAAPDDNVHDRLTNSKFQFSTLTLYPVG